MSRAKILVDFNRNLARVKQPAERFKRRWKPSTWKSRLLGHEPGVKDFHKLESWLIKIGAVGLHIASSRIADAVRSTLEGHLRMVSGWEPPEILDLDMSNPQSVLLVPEAAKILRISTRKVENLIASNQLRSFRIGRSRRILQVDLEDYVKMQRT